MVLYKETAIHNKRFKIIIIGLRNKNFRVIDFQPIATIVSIIC